MRHRHSRDELQYSRLWRSLSSAALRRLPMFSIGRNVRATLHYSLTHRLLCLWSIAERLTPLRPHSYLYEVIRSNKRSLSVPQTDRRTTAANITTDSLSYRI